MVSVNGDREYISRENRESSRKGRRSTPKDEMTQRSEKVDDDIGGRVTCIVGHTERLYLLPLYLSFSFPLSSLCMHTDTAAFAYLACALTPTAGKQPTNRTLVISACLEYRLLIFPRSLPFLVVTKRGLRSSPRVTGVRCALV